MLKIIRLFLPVLTAVLLLTDLPAQNNTYSPYSRFGIGDIAKTGLGRNSAMGGIGLGLRDPNYINYLNPASNSAQDTMSFIFSTGIAANAMQLASNEGSHNVSNISLSHIAVGFPISTRWKTNFGLIPYSQMGYKIMDIDLLNQAEYYYEGTGGLNQFFLGNAVQITRNISAGINVSYLFGSLNQTRRLLFPAAENRFSVNSKSTATIGDFSLKYGLQYNGSIRQEYEVTMGVTYENKTPLRTNQSLLTVNELSTGAGMIRDTVPNLASPDTHIDLPTSYGVGISFSKENKFMIGADYAMHQWSETSFMDQVSDSLVNSSSFRIGAQFIPDHSDLRSYLSIIHYRVGFHYSNTYLQLRGHQLKDYGITLGIGLPYRNLKTTFNFAVDIGKRGTKDFDLIQENYVNFNFSLSLYDFWFFKRRIE